MSKEIKIVNSLEETLNGGWPGLYGEVVTQDTYRIKQIDFVPDLVIDLGGNVFTFTRYVAELFPEALIVVVEPHEENFIHGQKFTPENKNIIALNKAIGTGQLYHATGAKNGSGECYLSEGLGYENVDIENSNLEKADHIQTVMIDELYNEYFREGDKVLLKLDIEGAENIIWGHEPSMEILAKIDFLTAEIHTYASDGGQLVGVKDKTAEAIERLSITHDIERDGVHLYATLKK